MNHFLHLYNRFGLTQMLVSKENIPKGTEFTVNYGYPFASGPLWYKVLMKRSIEDNQTTWQFDENLVKLSENVDVLHWNKTSEFVSLRLWEIERRK